MKIVSESTLVGLPLISIPLKFLKFLPICGKQINF